MKREEGYENGEGMNGEIVVIRDWICVWIYELSSMVEDKNGTQENENRKNSLLWYHNRNREEMNKDRATKIWKSLHKIIKCNMYIEFYL